MSLYLYYQGKQYSVSNIEGFRVVLFLLKSPIADSKFEQLIEVWNSNELTKGITSEPTGSLKKMEKIAPTISDLSKKRFEICKTCEESPEKGYRCKLYKGCCFWKWRAKPESKCPADPPKW